VVEALRRNGIWQAKSPTEQEGFIRHMYEEHLTPADVGKMAAKAGIKTIVMTHLMEIGILKSLKIFYANLTCKMEQGFGKRRTPHVDDAQRW
jgi:hypothetical protein